MPQRSSARLLLAVLLAINSACILIPIPTGEDKILAGTPIAEEQLSQIRPGETSAQEVLGLLGRPGLIWEDERVWIYSWEMRQGVLLWAVGGVAGGSTAGGGGVIDIPKHYLLLLRFDEDSRLVQMDKVSWPWHQSYADFLREWRQNSAHGQPR